MQKKLVTIPLVFLISLNFPLPLERERKPKKTPLLSGATWGLESDRTLEKMLFSLYFNVGNSHCLIRDVFRSVFAIFMAPYKKDKGERSQKMTLLSDATLRVLTHRGCYFLIKNVKNSHQNLFVAIG